MSMECFNGNGSGKSERVSNDYLSINNCGYYLNIDTDMRTYREHGRIDYQIICVTEGEGEFLVSGEKVTVGKGGIVIYPPNVRQDYFFSKSKNSSYCWIHFTGSGVEKLLESLNLNTGTLQINNSFDFLNTCKEITFECQIKAINYEMYISGLLISLLSKISRLVEKPNIKNKNLIKVLKVMHTQYKNDLTNDDYAKLCNLSKYHFIRVFKNNTGMTPHAYKAHLLIDKAKSLLSTTDLNINEIAEILAFDDAMYFSRIFKKFTGMSPTDFRNGQEFS